MFGLVTGLLYTLPTSAQVIRSDNTTGTVVTSDPSFADAFTIEGGSRPNDGVNLFHSFSEFSVPTDGEAIFDNATDVERIFSRVTGGSLSNIDGYVQTQGAADLFFLNPNGILLGPNSFLDIGGSFVGTTAASIQFPEAVTFGTDSVVSDPLLSVSAPIGLQMGQDPAAITFQSNYIESTPNETFALVGGSLSFQGTSDFAYIYAPDGDIELGSVGSHEAVLLSSDSQGWAFDYSDVTSFGDISIDRAYVETSGDGSGAIDLHGNSIELTGGAFVYTLTFGETAPVETSGTISFHGNRIEVKDGARVYSIAYGALPGGDIRIEANDSLSVMGRNLASGQESSLFSISQSSASGDGGSINIDTPSFEVLDGGVIYLGSYGEGNNGNLSVQAENIDISGLPSVRLVSRILSENYGTSAGEGGNIDLKTETLTFADGGRIIASTYSSSSGGNLTIDADTIEGRGDTASINPVQTLVGAFTTDAGDAGTANIITQDLRLTGDAQIFVSTRGSGAGGDLNITATDILFDRNGYAGFFSTGINTAVQDGGTGNAGSVNLQTERLSLLNGAQIFGGTDGFGDSGQIRIRAEETTLSGVGVDRSSDGFTPSAITAEGNPGSEGRAGNIDLQTDTLLLSDGGTITTTVGGKGTGGDIVIQADDIVLTGVSAEGPPSAIAATVAFGGEGAGGLVAISTDQLKIQAGARMLSSTRGVGNAGTIRVRSADGIEVDGASSQIQSGVGADGVGQGGLIDLQTSQLRVSDGGFISTETLGQGNAGNINIQSDRLLLLSNAEISSESSSDGDGGTIRLTGGSARLRDRSAITASTVSGNGGNLILNFSEDLILRDLSQLTAEAGGLGNGGNIEISAPFVIGTGNSDIIANAVRGNGGNIEISTQGLYGLEFRDQLTPENDITASSEFGVNGTVTINNLTTDPSASLVQLPESLANEDDQVAAACDATGGNQFIASGRGGIPASPVHGLVTNQLWIDFRDLELTTNDITHRERGTSIRASAQSSGIAESVDTNDVQPSTVPLVEASGWSVNRSGQIELVPDSVAASVATESGTCLTATS